MRPRRPCRGLLNEGFCRKRRRTSSIQPAKTRTNRAARRGDLQHGWRDDDRSSDAESSAGDDEQPSETAAPDDEVADSVDGGASAEPLPAADTGGRRRGGQEAQSPERARRRPKVPRLDAEQSAAGRARPPESDSSESSRVVRVCGVGGVGEGGQPRTSRRRTTAAAREPLAEAEAAASAAEMKRKRMRRRDARASSRGASGAGEGQRRVVPVRPSGFRLDQWRSGSGAVRRAAWRVLQSPHHQREGRAAQPARLAPTARRRKAPRTPTAVRASGSEA
uniref:Retrotransposon protein, putative, unclassified n=1 Tax=Macrostomum lignano TaxID=282301 RepID=A0A1I8F5D0_9PLAT